MWCSKTCATKASRWERRGWIVGQPPPPDGRRTNRGRPRELLTVRFLANVKVGDEGECWPWLGARYPTGYGMIGVDGRAMAASRLAYMLYVAPVPDGWPVCHHCDNPPCCNPRHLFLGTTRLNTQNSWAKGRLTHQGVRSGWLRLLSEVVEKPLVIRAA
jgi:hypothetical protein